MSLKSLLTSECTLQAETYTTNDFGEEIRGFTDPVSVKCRLNSLGRGNPNDLQLGQIIEENQYVLYVGPDTTITTGHKVTLGGSEYKLTMSAHLKTDAAGSRIYSAIYRRTSNNVCQDQTQP